MHFNFNHLCSKWIFNFGLQMHHSRKCFHKLPIQSAWAAAWQQPKREAKTSWSLAWMFVHETLDLICSAAISQLKFTMIYLAPTCLGEAFLPLEGKLRKTELPHAPEGRHVPLSDRCTAVCLFLYLRGLKNLFCQSALGWAIRTMNKTWQPDFKPIR